MTSDNPLLVRSGCPPFDRIEPEHVVPAVTQLLAESEQRVSEIEQSLTPTWDGLLEPLEAMDQAFEYTWSPVGHLLGVKNSQELRDAQEEIRPAVIEYSLRVSQSKPIYEGLVALKASEEWKTLAGAQQRIVDSMILNAELAGIGLEGEQRQRFNEIAQRLAQLSNDFSNNVLDATKRFDIRIHDAAIMEGIPNSARALAAASYRKAIEEEQQKPELVTERDTTVVGEPVADADGSADRGPWRFTLDIPSYLPLMQHCRDRSVRETMYRGFLSKASSGEFDNTPLIDEILTLRQEKASLLGYASYAEMSLAKKMAESVESIEEVLERLRAASFEPARQDLDSLRELAASSGQTEPVMNWDVAFWSERLREKLFDFTDEELRPYFAFERVLDGLFALLTRLFGITVEAADGTAPVWHPDVRFFVIKDETGKTIAAFYLDPYSRPEDKQGGAWMADCLSRRVTDGKLQIPVAHLICNSTPPVDDTPSLMTFREVETLFHEFGHGLQHMLTTVDFASAAGISNVEWDAVELPSQFMENWCYHRPTLMGLAKHHSTGGSLPDALFQKIVDARTFQAGTMMLRQLLFGLTDLELHHRYDPSASETPFDVQRRIAEKTSALPPLPEDRFLCGFKHIFAGGYAAGYYSYKWAEVLSADAFSAFEEAGLDDEETIRETGYRFRDTVLAEGGSRHPMEIFKDFRGREPSPEPLLRHTGLKDSAGG